MDNARFEPQYGDFFWNLDTWAKEVGRLIHSVQIKDARGVVAGTREMGRVHGAVETAFVLKMRIEK